MLPDNAVQGAIKPQPAAQISIQDSFTLRDSLEVLEVFMVQEQQHFSVKEAVAHQRSTLGRVLFGEDALYSLARRGVRGTIRVGQKKIFLTRELIERLLSGELDTHELAATA